MNVGEIKAFLADKPEGAEVKIVPSYALQVDESSVPKAEPVAEEPKAAEEAKAE